MPRIKNWKKVLDRRRRIEWQHTIIPSAIVVTALDPEGWQVSYIKNRKSKRRGFRVIGVYRQKVVAIKKAISYMRKHVKG